MRLSGENYGCSSITASWPRPRAAVNESAFGGWIPSAALISVCAQSHGGRRLFVPSGSVSVLSASQPRHAKATGRAHGSKTLRRVALAAAVGLALADWSRAAVLTWAPGGAGGGVGNWDTSTADNARLGTAVFAHMLVQAGWDEELALAFYYQGWKSIELYGIFDETHQYVENVLSLAAEFE